MAEVKQKLIVEERRELSLSGVLNVDSFDEQRIELNSSLGGLAVFGEGMKIAGLDLTLGNIRITGRIDALAYGQSREERSLRHKSKNVVSRLLK